MYKPFSIRNSCSGCNMMLERLRKLTDHKSEFIIAMESTGHYRLTLYTRLRKEGYQVVVLDPIQTDSMRGMLMLESKTDGLDTLVIAETIRFGRYKASNVPQEKMMAPLCWNAGWQSSSPSSIRLSHRSPVSERCLSLIHI